jgi:DNA-binding PadR family transcriptional regulator
MMSPMIRRSLTIEYTLLGFLFQGPLHGYKLHQQLSDPAGFKSIWLLKQAQLYALLDKLEEAGYIAGTNQQQEARPARRVFRLTPAGQAAFQDWISNPVQRPRQMRQEFLAKLYFAQLQGAEVYSRLVAAQRQVCQRWLEGQTTAASQQDSSGFAWLVDQFRSRQIQAMIDWLDLCHETLAAPPPTDEQAA